ncbi:pyridoxine 5'-phosphate synthase [bacterium]|jgi:pyridoxine 5-phosphate synthase|nr:pyridoxine 5'-phosphate synthase [bacterium]
MAKLGVNIDHVATIRQARRGNEPDPVWAAVQAELAGADGITLHLREDRRHIQDRDARILRQTVQTKYNLEMAATPEMVALAIELQADQVTLVPERREEITTEGGLDVAGALKRMQEVTHQLCRAGIEVSMFIDADPKQVVASKECGAQGVELHTGPYAHAFARREEEVQAELIKLVEAGRFAREYGMKLHAGHGLNYQNVQPVARIEEMGELNIGHSIISRAVFVGIGDAVREMKRLITSA